MGKQVDCPLCGQPFLAEAPVAKPLGRAEAGEEDADEPAVMLAADDESDLMVVHPAIFRRHLFGTILCVLLLLGGAGLIIFGAVTATLWVVPGLYFLIGGGLGILLGGFFLLKWHIIGKTHKLTITTERSIYRSGIIHRFTSEVRHDDVRNIKMDQNYKERLLKIGDIAISSAGQDEMEIVIRDIPHPQDIADLIRRQQ
ncbi:PH domain-containing protein [soil metagenome]